MHPFLHLETGKVVWRHRGRAGYVPIDDSENAPDPEVAAANMMKTRIIDGVAVGNAPPPDVGADNMKAKMAALDDSLDIPESLRRAS
jgi:hypothetical protein